MLLKFSFSNYRSFLTETELDLAPRGIKEFENSVIRCDEKHDVLPAMAVYGKNGGGKSNFTRAFWLGVTFILNAQQTQHEGAPVPVRPFLLNETAQSEPTSFAYTFFDEGIRYEYGFSATREKIVDEYLYHYPKKQKAVVFKRTGDDYYFPGSTSSSLKKLIAKAVASNQLYFAVASVMNEPDCARAMRWFRNKVFFTRSYTDIANRIMEAKDDSQAIEAMKQYAQEADLGIDRMAFKFENHQVDTDSLMANNGMKGVPEELKRAMREFYKALAASPNVSETSLNEMQLKAVSWHKGIDRSGNPKDFSLSLADESDGTRRLMFLAPELESALRTGGLVVADEPEIGMHPLLMRELIRKFQNPETNPYHAQIIFTTHDTNFLKLDLLRRDQFCFVEKNPKTGVSELYGLEDLKGITSANAEKSYLLGKFGGIPTLEDED